MGLRGSERVRPASSKGDDKRLTDDVGAAKGLFGERDSPPAQSSTASARFSWLHPALRLGIGARQFLDEADVALVSLLGKPLLSFVAVARVVQFESV